ncbi:MAG: sulfatase [Planctomycetota bacterium]
MRGGRRRGRRGLEAAATLLFGCAAGCDRSDDLQRANTLRLARFVVEDSFRGPDGPVTPTVEHDLVLPAESFSSTIVPGVWCAELPAPTLSSSDGAQSFSVEVGGKTFERYDRPLSHGWFERAAQGEAEVVADIYLDHGSQLYVSFGGPAEDVDLTRELSRGGVRNGAWKGHFGRFTGNLFALLPGESCRVPASLAGEGTLLGSYLARGQKGETSTLRVRRGGEVVFEVDVTLEARVTEVPFEVPLGTGTGELIFSVSGQGAGAVLTPRVVADGATRTRPNIVLFVADTLRRDALSAYGAPASDTPNLDRLLTQGTSFVDARSTASWTLPGHAAMLAGMYPAEAGADHPLGRIADEAVTLAEVLRQAGYRTVAVVDGAYLDASFGLAQGFERYESELGDFAGDLATARRLLESPDPRPTFLVLHTFRVHEPFHVDDDVARELFGPDVPLPSAQELVLELFVDDLTGLDAPLAQYAALYRGGVVSLDRRLGEWLDGLERDDLLEQTLFTFTSDHGEAFGETGFVGHGLGVQESLVRVPLAFWGASVEPGVVREDPASLVDLPRTLASFAGAEAPTSWRGRDLFGGGTSEILLQGRRDGTSMAGVVDDGRKVVLDVGRGFEPIAAHDLRADPEEELSDLDAPWVAEWSERWRPALEESLVPRYGQSSANVSSEAALELRALGYLGD